MPVIRSFVLPFLGFSVLWATGYSVDLPAETRALLTGVSQCQVGIASGISIIGSRCFPILAGGEKTKTAVAAAGSWEKGKLLAFGHGTPIEREDVLTDSDTGRLLENAVRWMGGSRGKVGVFKSPKVTAYLSARGIDTIDLGRDWRSALTGVQVLIAGNQILTEDSDVRLLQNFIGRGGGLVTGTCAWGWAQLHPGKSIREDLPLNRVLVRCGLAFNEEVVFSPAKGFSVSTDPALSAHLAALELGAGRSSVQVEATLMEAIRALPPGETVFRLHITAMVDGMGDVFPTEKKPLVRGKHSRERLAVALGDSQWMAKPGPAPAAVDFPGEVPPSAPAVDRMVSVDPSIPQWQTTGLYAPAGSTVLVTIPASLVGRKWSVRIGAHTDSLWDLEKWTRWPGISVSTPLAGTTTSISSPFGGAIYIVLPKPENQGPVKLRIQGAVEAPRYTRGKTSAAGWLASRDAPAPWAELEGKRIILTVPSSVIRDLEDPESLLAFWDEVVLHEDRLAGWTLEDRRRPERFVVDRQISAGYMHSGYPIMAHMDVARDNVTLDRLRGTPEKPGAWGQWHELGHNHQEAPWVPANQGEVTVNLFSLAVQMQLLGAKVEQCWGGNLAPDKRMERIKSYLDTPSMNPGNWDPALGLAFYWQLIDGFGFDTLGRVLSGYRTAPPSPSPKTDGEKWETWLTRYSHEAKRNLGPFFKAWRIPVGQASLVAAAAEGDAWMHPDMGR